VADPQMSDYELRAYQHLTAPPEDSRSIVPRQARELASRIGRAVQMGASKRLSRVSWILRWRSPA